MNFCLSFIIPEINQLCQKITLASRKRMTQALKHTYLSARTPWPDLLQRDVDKVC